METSELTEMRKVGVLGARSMIRTLRRVYVDRVL